MVTIHFLLTANDDVQKDMNTLLGDEKYVTSDSVRVSEDVPRSLPSPLPKRHTPSITYLLYHDGN